MPTDMDTMYRINTVITSLIEELAPTFEAGDDIDEAADDLTHLIAERLRVGTHKRMEV